MSEPKRKGCRLHLLVDLLLFAGLVFVYFNPRQAPTPPQVDPEPKPVSVTLPIPTWGSETVSVYLEAGESPLYCKEFPAGDVIPILRQITYEPYPVADGDYTAPGCPTLEILVHHVYGQDILYCVSITASTYGDMVLVYTPDLLNSYGFTVCYLGTWPGGKDFWPSIDDDPENIVPYDSLPSKQLVHS